MSWPTIFGIGREKRSEYQFWSYHTVIDAFSFHYVKKSKQKFVLAKAISKKVGFALIIPFALIADIARGIWYFGFCNMGILYHNLNAQLLHVKEEEEKKSQPSLFKKVSSFAAFAFAGAGSMAMFFYRSYLSNLLQMGWKKIVQIF